jgi:glycosyltransferase involved in cell wall biosynthesis
VQKKKLIRFTTHAISLRLLLENQLKFLNNYFEVIAVSSPHKDLDIVANREDVRVIPIKMEREISVIKDFKSLINLFILLRKEKPDLIHSNTPKSSLLSMIAGFLSFTKIRIYTVTGLRFEGETGGFKRLLILMEKLTCFFATHLIAEGEGVKKIMLNNNITKKKISIIGKGSINGVDIERFSKENILLPRLNQIRKTINYNEDCFYFLFIGRLVRDKGINELIDTFVELCEERTNIKLILVGDFEFLAKDLNPKCIESIKNNENIIFIGFSFEVEYYFAISDCFVFPSYREGFPNVVLQAASMGCPIICSNIPANLEILSNEDENIYFETRNKSSLKKAMEHALNNIGIMSFNSTRLKERVVNDFSRETVQKNMLDFYNNLLNK